MFCDKTNTECTKMGGMCSTLLVQGESLGNLYTPSKPFFYNKTMGECFFLIFPMCTCMRLHTVVYAQVCVGVCVCLCLCIHLCACVFDQKRHCQIKYSRALLKFPFGPNYNYSYYAQLTGFLNIHAHISSNVVCNHVNQCN